MLKFVVAERNLLPMDVYSADTLLNNAIRLPHISYVGRLIFRGLANFPAASKHLHDAYYALSLTFNISKTLYSYGVQKTMYPDQGITINIFSTLPRLVFTSASFRSYLAVGSLTKLCVGALSRENAELLTIFRKSLHSIPFLFPYERVEINSHGPYSSVEEYLTIQLYVAAFTLKLKHSS